PLPAESYIMAANVKAFPCLATGQSVVAAGIEMHRHLRGAVERLSRFRLVIPDTPGLRRQKDDPGRIKPASREAADHSFNFLAAVALIDGEFGLAQFDGERWNDPKVCALMARLEIVNDSAWNRRAPDSYPCSLEVRTEDGREEVVEVAYPPGFSRGQLEAETVIKKFSALTAPHLSQRVRDRIIEAVIALDESPSCAELIAALATDYAAAPPEPSRSASRRGWGWRGRRPACAGRRGRALRARAREPPSKRDNSRVDGIRRRSASDSVSSAARFAISASSVRRVAAMSPGS